jgi:hypothetical protein
MINPFVPKFDGRLEVDQIPNDFVARIRKRVEEGFLVRGYRSRRTSYTVRSATSDEIILAAENFLTAYNVGLNNVHVRRGGPTTLLYQVSFWRWTWTAVAHGAMLGLLLLVCFATIPEMRREVAAYSFGPVILTGLLVFFSLLWPWILTAVHRPIAKKTLLRILRGDEVISAANAGVNVMTSRLGCFPLSAPDLGCRRQHPIRRGWEFSKQSGRSFLMPGTRKDDPFERKALEAKPIQNLPET